MKGCYTFLIYQPYGNKRRSEVRWLRIIWGAFAVIWFGLILIYYFPEHKLLFGDEGRYYKNGLQFANHFTIQNNSPLWPMGYSYFVGFCLWTGQVLGLTHPVLIVQIVQLIFLLLAGILFWDLTKILSSLKIRVLAFGLFILNPTLIAYSQYLWPEIIHLTLYLGVFWIILHKKKSTFWYSLLGLLLASASLTKLVYLPISVLIISTILILDVYHRRSKALALVPLLVFFLAITPTLYKNYHVHGTAMIADSSMFNLWIGLGDPNKSEYVDKPYINLEFPIYHNSGTTHREREIILKSKIKNFVKEKGIFQIFVDQISKQYFRLFDHRTFLIKQLPNQFVPTYRFENAKVEKMVLWSNGVIWCILLVGLGIGILDRLDLRRSVFLLLLGILIYNLGLFLFLHVKTRFVIQFLPILCLVSANGFYKAYFWRDLKKRKDYGLFNIVLGLLLVLLLLRLGFDSLF